MRILGIDPGEKNIGIAISDISATLARPLMVLPHSSRKGDAQRIIEIAEREQVAKIVVGQATDMDGKPNFSGRKAARLAAEIRSRSAFAVELWDESFSTQKAVQSRIKIGTNRKGRQGHLDEIAAAIILQSYLDMNSTADSDEKNSI